MAVATRPSRTSHNHPYRGSSAHSTQIMIVATMQATMMTVALTMGS